MKRFDYLADEDGECYEIIDSKQGSVAKGIGKARVNPIAVVYDMDLADRIVTMLNLAPGYYSQRTK